MEYQVTYNGYTVEFFGTIEEVDNWIDSKIHKNLSIQKEWSQHIDAFTTIRIYQYTTLYSEMFLIEKKN